MAAIGDPDVPGFFAPVHRALTDPILMGGAPRTVAIANGTLAAAIALDLRLWIPGALMWGGGTHRRRLGRQTRPAVRRRVAPASALPAVFRRVRLPC
jgi:type IV secretory pathway TrbD component